MDGARFSNALSFLKLKPREITWEIGLDCLSLGATKNGAYAAEAIVFNSKKLIIGSITIKKVWKCYPKN